MRILLFFLLFSFSSLLLAQKPKLGLVLSGGGAKGMAHVGVLKELENAGLRPDYIAGTSMGSVVGAMYAIGYSADQIEEILREINWDEILSNNIPLNYISYEEKEYYNRYLLEFPIVGRKLKLPSGLIEGQLLSEAINHYTWPSMNYDNFDEFPIPFRCVATDVSTGKEIIFKDGSLSEALRASMAIPTAFTATSIDSTLAVDGGVVNNFPANILKEMGADIIVGMNVTRGFQDASKVNDLAGILMQISMLKSNERLPEQRALCDVYIQPNLDEYNTASFNKYDEIIEIGHNEASLYSSKLDSLAKLTGKGKLQEGVNDSNLIIVPSKIELDGNKLFSDELIRSKLGYKANDSLSHKDLEEGIRRVYGINGFYKVEYRLKREDGHFSLRLKMKEKPAATIKTSFHYDNNFSAGIVLNLTIRDLLLNSSRTVLAGDISENPRFRFDYYKYAGNKKRAALNIRYNFINEQLPVYQGGEKVDLQINAENTYAINLLSTQKLKNSYLIGAVHQTNRFRSEFAGFLPAEMKHVNFDFSSFQLGYTRNSLNNSNYPTRGAERLFVGEVYVKSNYRVRFENPNDSASFNSILGKDLVFQNEAEANDYLNTLTPETYGRIYFRSMDYSNVGENFQIIPKLALAGILSIDSNAFFNDHYLGGYQQVRPTDTRAYGLHYGEKLVNNFGLVGLYFQNIFANHFFLNYGVNAIGWYEHVPLNDLSSFDASKFWNEQTMLGYGVQIVYKSFVGPMTIGVSSNTQDGYVRFYFGVGYSFNFRD